MSPTSSPARSRRVTVAAVLITWFALVSCAFGQSGASTGNPLETWTRRGSDLTTAWLNDVVYTGERFVAVGSNGCVVRSPDGVAWSLVNPGTTTTFYGAAVGADTIVAVGYSSTGRAAVAYSSDGLTWTSATVPALSGVVLRRVAHGADRFVAVGSAGRILVSEDGAIWSSVTSPTSLDLYSVRFANGHFVVGAASGKLLYSADGLYWQVRNTEATTSFTALAFHSNTWYAAASSSGSIWGSSDGLTWSQSSTTGESIVGIWDLHASAGGQLVGVAFGDIVHADSTLAWSAVDVTGDDDIWLNAVAEGNGTLVAVGNSGRIFQSGEPTVVAPSFLTTEGFDALPVNEEISLAISGNGAATVELWVDGAKVAEVGGDATTIAWTPTRIGPHTLELRGIQSVGTTISSDAVMAVAIPTFIRRIPTDTWPALYDVTYTGELFVAVGDSGKIFVSPDGVAWQEKTLSQTAVQFRAATAGNGTVVAVGYGYFGTSGQPSGAGAYSTDGVNWLTATVPASLSQLTSVTYGGGRFVAVGASGKIAVSTSGKTWNEVVSGTTEQLLAVRYANGRFMASGWNGTILTSTDGLSWTARTVGAYDSLEGLTHYNDEWVVVGNNFNVWTSSDGAAWVRRRSGSGSASGPRRLVAAGDGFLYGVGLGGAVYFTESPESWSSVDLGLESSNTVYGIAAGNDTVVVVGASRTILQAGDPRVTTPAFADVAEDDIFTIGSDVSLEISRGTGVITELLVNGVSIGSATGATTVTWTPTHFGSYELSLRGTNADGEMSESIPVQVNVGLENWSWRHRLPFGGDLYAAAYAFGKWWVIGSSRVIMSSSDTSDWRVSESQQGASFTSVAASPSRLVATASGYDYSTGRGATGSIFTSTDGTSWELAQGTIATSTNGIRAVAYSNGQWVAVGPNGAIGTSQDGLAWVQQASPVSESLIAVASNGSTTAPLWIAIGSTGSILASADGQTWTVRYTLESTYYGLYSVAHQGGRWIVTGLNRLLLTSEDGSTWTTHSAPSPGYTSLAVVKGAFIATDYWGGVSRSTDGVTWTKLYGGNSYYLSRPGIADSTAGAIIVGQAGEILSSTDGLNWTLRTRGPANSLRAVLKTGDRYLFAGSAIDYSLGASTPGSPILTGPSLENIAPSSLRVSDSSYGAGAELYGLSYGAGVYCAVGSGGAIFTSSNGSEWTSRASGVNTSLLSVAYRRGLHVAVGSDGRIVTSGDGISWSTRSSGVTAELKSVVASLRTYVAVGNSGTILTSNDGVTWTKRTSGTAANLAQVAWHPHYGFLTVGDSGVVLASTDGVGWEMASDVGYVYFNAVVATAAGFVASSSSNGLIYTSGNGRSWAASYFPAPYGINHLAMAGDELVAFGSFGKILSHQMPAADPRITVAPRDIAVSRGRPATLSVTATGTGPLSYQWFKDGLPVAGANYQTLPIAFAATADAGYYTVIVTNANGDVAVSEDVRFVVDTPAPPTITASPQAVTIYRDQSATFSVTATGSGTLNYQWLKDGLPIAGAMKATLTVANASATDAGNYSVRVINDVDTASSGFALLVVNEPPAITMSTTEPAVALGGRVTLSVAPAGSGPFTYQWWKNGMAIAGATSASLTIDRANSANAGAYTVTISDQHGSTTSPALDLQVNLIRLTNLSIRTRTAPGDDLLVAGFVMDGSGSKPLLLRGVGPTLKDYDVTSAVSDCELRLFRSIDGVSELIASNDNWGASTAAPEIVATAVRLGAFELPSASLDAVLLPTLSPGVFSMEVPAKAGGTGIALAEVYDANSANEDVRLVNISARARAGIGDDVLVAGFVVDGPGTLKLLVRGVGPKLADFKVAGVLANPQIRLWRRVGDSPQPVAYNDDWATGADAAQIESTATLVGAFALPSASKDAALLLTLEAGIYTVELSGVGNTAGVALIEVYVVP